MIQDLEKMRSDIIAMQVFLSQTEGHMKHFHDLLTYLLRARNELEMHISDMTRNR